MACSCCGSSSACDCTGNVLTGRDLASTLIASLTPTVDCIRDIATQLGARPYRVSLVWTRWSGGSRGEGHETVEREEALTPTPYVKDVSDLDRKLMPGGAEEVGDVKVTEISPRYTEDYLCGRDENGNDIPDDVSFYWEVLLPQARGNGIRRRYYPAGPPNTESTDFQWSIRLKKISENRQRDGLTLR